MVPRFRCRPRTARTGVSRLCGMSHTTLNGWGSQHRFAHAPCAPLVDVSVAFSAASGSTWVAQCAKSATSRRRRRRQTRTSRSSSGSVLRVRRVAVRASLSLVPSLVPCSTLVTAFARLHCANVVLTALLPPPPHPRLPGPCTEQTTCRNCLERSVRRDRGSGHPSGV